MYAHILVPFDGSANATAAIDHAVGLKRLTECELTILTIYRHYSMLEASLSMVRPGEPGNMDDAMREHAREIAEAGKQHAIEKGAKDIKAFVRNGPVARGIVAFAKERKVDLIVLGSRGLGSVEDYLLGSVSHKVTGTAHCPVLVVSHAQST